VFIVFAKIVASEIQKRRFSLIASEFLTTSYCICCKFIIPLSSETPAPLQKNFDGSKVIAYFTTCANSNCFLYINVTRNHTKRKRFSLAGQIFYQTAKLGSGPRDYIMFTSK